MRGTQLAKEREVMTMEHQCRKLMEGKIRTLRENIKRFEKDPKDDIRARCDFCGELLYPDIIDKRPVEDAGNNWFCNDDCCAKYWED